MRGAVSIPAHIAEGLTKCNAPVKLRYLNIAQGSLEKSRFQVLGKGLPFWKLELIIIVARLGSPIWFTDSE